MVIYIKKVDTILLLILLLIISGTVEVNPGPAQRSINALVVLVNNQSTLENPLHMT